MSGGERNGIHPGQRLPSWEPSLGNVESITCKSTETCKFCSLAGCHSFKHLDLVDIIVNGFTMMHTGTQSLCDLYTFERLRGSGSLPILRICGPETDVSILVHVLAREVAAVAWDWPVDLYLRRRCIVLPRCRYIGGTHELQTEQAQCVPLDEGPIVVMKNWTCGGVDG